MPSGRRTPAELTRRFEMKMSEEEYQTLDRLSRRDGRSMANYIRRLIEEARQAIELVDREKARWLEPPPVRNKGSGGKRA